MGYVTVIGLETHVELGTKSKIFCGCSTAFGGEPNTRCCPVCMGFPGTLPVLNKMVLQYAVAVGLALNCDITKTISFDRKNYFYPDLPKAYQISQRHLPIGRNGFLEIETEEGKKKIGIHEIHMEEDAGKLIHDLKSKKTAVDFNRCGIPLIEIVSEPHLSSAKEAVAYLEKLKMTMQYLGVSDCKMQEGSFRADINVSVKKDKDIGLGTRTEMKNMNSFKAIGRAIEEESRRQVEVLSKGGCILQETRRWDDAESESLAMRSKEDSKEYRYFREPDLPEFEISEEWILKIKKSQPEFREEKRKRYVREFGISDYDAGVLTVSKAMAELFEKSAKLSGNPKEAANWLMGDAIRFMKETDTEPEDLLLTAEQMASFIHLLDSRTINRTVAKTVFEEMFQHQADPIVYVKQNQLELISDDIIIAQAIKTVFQENQASVQDYYSGKSKAMAFLLGQAMKLLKGKADPLLLGERIKQMLSERRSE